MLVIVNNSGGGITTVIPFAGDFVNNNGVAFNPLNMGANTQVTIIADNASGQWYVIAE
jgi:hypothetical protein